MSRAFTPSWLADDAAALEFLPRHYADPGERLKILKETPPIRPEVFEIFEAQEKRRGLTPAREENLRRLSEGARAVVTGQQVGLFLGPLYTLHKAASAIVNARELSEASGVPVVPIFWVQTEDHDYEEICSAGYLSADGVGEVRLGDPLPELERRVSLSERLLGEAIEGALATLQEAGLAGRHHDEVVALLRRHYQPDKTWGDAFSGLLAEIFGDAGLLIFDPRESGSREQLAALARPVHAFALTREQEVFQALKAREEALVGAGFKAQIPIREAALSCYAAEPGASRHRLERGDGEGWGTRVVGEVDVMAALEEAPERFTTTALLRPLWQDVLLPTVAYVGGPGELAYFAQLPPLYALWGRPMPMAVPRARWRLVTATARRLAEQLGVEVSAADEGEEALALQLSRADLAPFEARHAALKLQVEEGLDALEREAERLQDQGYGRVAKRSRETIQVALERLLERAQRTAIQANEVTAKRLQRFLAILAPQAAPQERVLTFVSFAAQVGIGPLVTALIEGTEAWSGALKDLEI